jgi:outer membrane receptor protein involved in Fe transport
MSDMPYGSGRDQWTTEGTGTAANPISYAPYGRRENSSFAGVIQKCVPACPGPAGGVPIGDMNYQFSADGQNIIPYDRGVRGGVDANGNPTTGSSNLNSGGDGAYSPFGQVFSSYRTATAFGRFSYDLTDDINFYIQGQASEAYSFGWYFPMKVQPGAGQAAIFYKNNPYLTLAQQTMLGNNGTNPLQNPTLSPAVQPSNTFQIGKFFVGLGQDQTNATQSTNRVLSMQTGAKGTLMDGRFNWNVFYTHAENRQAVDLLNNQNLQQMYAAQDAVQTPTGIQCYAATQAATAVAYKNCRPINVFGVNNVSWSVYNNIFQLTKFNETNILDDLGGSVSGEVMDAWAGPITAALSAEMRFQQYGIRSNVPSSTNVDCTGLRICNANLPLYSQSILQPTDADDNVWEVALESEVPLVKNVPMIQALDLNLAGRYTDYSTSGSVETWKVGFSWSVVDALRFRGTTSIDIRAPTLDDLYRPATLLENVFTDLHVIVPGGGNYTSTTTYSSQGNPNLKPEVARTYTVGAVLTPDRIPGLTVSLDYFRIHMANAIGQIGPGTTIQTLCENSGGTSIYCDNYQRPFPFSDHSINNYASKLFTFNLNTASVETEGWDFEADYSWEMSDLVSDWKGSWTSRLLTTYQPVTQKSVLFPGAPWSRIPTSPVRATAFLNYKLNDWSLGLQDTWVSGFSKVSGPVTPLINNWVDPHTRSWNQVDVNISRDFSLEGADMTGYLSVQNVFNRQPDYVPNGTIGQWYPVATNGYSVQSPMGRYFTIGVKANL